MPDDALIEQLDHAIDVLLRGGSAEGPVPGDLVEIARALREMPDDNFKLRLKSQLERRTSMSAAAIGATQIREGFRTVTPYLTLAEGDKFIEFLKQTFGAEEVLRHAHRPGAFHAEVRIDDAMLMIGSDENARGHERPSILHAYVENCDAAYARAIAAGAKSLGEPADRPYGERSGFIQDPFGNTWYLATRATSALFPKGGGAIVPYLHPNKVRPYMDFLARAFGGEQLSLFEHEGRVVHSSVRIGDAVLEMGEGQEVLPSAFFMYVEDVDAVYERAVAAGATSVSAPADKSHGHRDATLVDPFGYTWYPATLLAR